MGQKLNKSNRNLIIQYLSRLVSTLLVSMTISIAISQSAVADNKDENGIPWYQVEVIIFANQSYLGLSSETWPDPEPLKVTSLRELNHPRDAALDPKKTSQVPNFQAGSKPAMPTPFELLDKTELQLVPVAKKLAASQKYQSLLHIGWRQPTLSPDDSTPIYIYQGVDTPMIDDPVEQTQQPRAVMREGAAASKDGNRFKSVPVGSFTYDSSQYGQLLPVTETDIQIGPRLSQLYGTLRLSVSRYLHMEANLNYRMPILKEEVVPVNAEQDFVGSSFLQNMVLNQPGGEIQTKIQKREALQNFHLFETRRMRSKEIHYFDNPVIGIVVRVIPYDFPKIEPDFDPASQAFTTGNGDNTAPQKAPQ